MSEYPKKRRATLPSLFLQAKLHKRLILILIALVGMIIFILPLIRLVMVSFVVEDGSLFQNYIEILNENRTWTIIKNTMIVVVGSTILALVLGISAAWVIAYSDVRRKGLLQVMLLLPFLIPSYIMTLSWTQFTGSSGLYSQLIDLIPLPLPGIQLYSHGGMIFILGLSHYPLVFLLTKSILERIPREMEWAVRASGGNQWSVFRRVTLPLALPGISSGGLLAFLANLDNFGIPAFLGIPSNITVMSTAIFQEVVGYGQSAFVRAATFSVLLGVFALLASVIQWLLLRKSKLGAATEVDQRPRFYLGKWRTIVEWAIWLFLIGISIVPLISMVQISLIKAYGLPFTWENIGLQHYQFVLFENDKATSALFNSLLLAGGSALICLVGGTLFAYMRLRKPSWMMRAQELIIALPYALPGMVVALSMILAWMQPIPGWNPGIYGSITILFIAYVTRFMYLQVRASMTALTQVAPEMEEAAHSSGASGFAKWRRILIPYMMPGLLSGAGLVFLTALTELTVSALLWSSGNETIGLVIFNFEQSGYTTYSTAFSTLIMIFMFSTIGIFLLLQTYWKKRMGIR